MVSLKQLKERSKSKRTSLPIGKNCKVEPQPSVIKPRGASRSPGEIRGANPDTVKTPNSPGKVSFRSKMGKEEYKISAPPDDSDSKKRLKDLGGPGVLPGDKKPTVVGKEPTGKLIKSIFNKIK